MIAAVTSAKKGVSVWAFKGLHRALSESGASWYFNWQAGHPGVTSPHGVQFVPMIWGAGSVTRANLRQARQAAFVTRATAMLKRLKFVQRYAWFALPATAGDGTAGLFRPGAIATSAGRAFESAGS